MKGAVPHPERTNKKCPNTPQKKCPSINVKNSKRSMSATNSPISKKYSLSPENKKSLDLFVSLMINSSNSIDRLYSFCEHHFREELVQIVTKKLDEYITDFKNLLVQIQTQKIVTSQLEADQRPNSVSFSISNWRNYSDENWPDTTSDDWIKVAVSHFTKTAPELPTSPKKQTQTWEERIANAEIKRKRIENIKNREIRMKTNKIRRVNERMNLQQEEAKSTINEKLDTALQRREAILNQIVEKAHNEIEKIQENNFMQRLENEGKKLQLERNMDKATKRHQEMVQDIRNKAKERTASKNQISPDMSPPKKKPKAVTLTEAINQKFLPEEIFPLKGISYEDIPIITIPTFNEEEPKKSQILEKLSKAMINEEQNQSQHIINYLKAINDQKSFIKWESPEAKVIYESLQLILVSNHSNGSQILRHVINLLPNSYPFVFNIGFRIISLFHEYCHQVDSLPTTKEIISLWTSILNCQYDETQILLLSQMIYSSVIRYLCYIIEIVKQEDLKNESTQEIINLIIQLLKSISLFLQNNKAKIPLELFQLVNKTSSYIYSSLFNYLILTKSENAIHIISLYMINFHDNLDEILKEDNIEQILNIVKSFITSKEVSKEFILFIGIVCRYSNVFREKCNIGNPSILSILCGLPLSYFIQKEESNVLIPTLVAICYHSPENIKTLKQKINISILSNFMKNIQQNEKDLFSPHFRFPVEEKLIIMKTLEEG